MSASTASTDPAPTITAPSGDWTVEFNTNVSAGSAARLWWAWRSAPSGGLTSPQSFTTSVDCGTVWVAQVISGADASPIDVKSTVSTGTSINPSSASATTTVADTLVFRLMAADDNDGSSTMNPPSTTMGANDWSESIFGGNGHTVGSAYATQASIGATGAATWTLDASEEWAASTVAIAPKGPATGDLAATEAADTLSAAGGTPATADLTQTEAADTLVGLGVIPQSILSTIELSGLLPSSPISLIGEDDIINLSAVLQTTISLRGTV